MAKLSAHGTEVARIITAVDAPSGDSLVSRRERVYSFRSDGHILRREVVTFKSDGRRHDYGWKLWKRYSARSITPARIAADAAARRDVAEQRGTLVSFTASTVL